MEINRALTIVNGCGLIKLKVSIVQSVSRLNAATFYKKEMKAMKERTWTFEILRSREAKRYAASSLVSFELR